MATNKNALIRYQVFDRCFRNPGRMYFWEDLLEECNKALLEFNPESEGIKRRQMFDDIRFMESSQGWSVPLEKNRYGKKVYYRYSDLNFSINNQPLSETEANQIKSTLMIMSRFTGTPQFEWINEIIPVLEDKLGLVGQDNQVIEFDSNLDLKGLNFLTPLFNAVINKRVLKIKYKDFKNPEPYNIIFHPYYLKQYNNRWFSIGLNEETQKPNWTIALDRIEDVEETDSNYQPCNIDWQEYFDDIIGVTRPDNVDVQEVKLKFTPQQAPYILTKPIHPTQKHKYDETGLEVRIEVIPNYELESLILSFGENVRVVAPEDLRDRVLERLKIAAKVYKNE